jgi:hypothetical protein
MKTTRFYGSALVCFTVNHDDDVEGGELEALAHAAWLKLDFDANLESWNQDKGVRTKWVIPGTVDDQAPAFEAHESSISAKDAVLFVPTDDDTDDDQEETE